VIVYGPNMPSKLGSAGLGRLLLATGSARLPPC
jgi:hypothetical protein